MPKRNRWNAIIDRLPADKPCRVAEIGVWCGDCSENVLKLHDKVKLIQVDRWQKYTDTESEAEGNARMSKYDQRVFDDAKKLNFEKIAPFKNRVKTIESDSSKAAEQIKDGYLDAVFIDGAHSYEGCKADIISWLPKVKKGGWIGGHDYPGRQGVYKSVHEIFGDDIETDADRTWWRRV